MTFCCSATDPMDCEERATCETPGAVGHYYCGFCELHGKARHNCGDILILEDAPAPAEVERMDLDEAWAALEESFEFDRDC